MSGPVGNKQYLIFSCESIKIWAELCFSSTGNFRGVCKKIDHFPEDADYEADAAEYLLRKFDMIIYFGSIFKRIFIIQTC